MCVYVFVNTLALLSLSLSVSLSLSLSLLLPPSLPPSLPLPPSLCIPEAVSSGSLCTCRISLDH